jgi:hypothetical protein
MKENQYEGSHFDMFLKEFGLFNVIWVYRSIFFFLNKQKIKVYYSFCSLQMSKGYWLDNTIFFSFFFNYRWVKI